MSKFFTPAAPPKTPLGIHRILSPQAGVRVSPLCLGAMSIGEAWSESLGSMSKPQSMALLDAFYDAGGNFVDTSSNYQNDQSEQWIGEWMEAKGVRDQMVIATKFTTNYREYINKAAEGSAGIVSNYGGNHSKALQLSVRDSLHKLKTDYIDLLYLHWWDYTTSVEEVMRSLDNLVRAGKVLYLGVSDTPAWIVAKANQYAKDHGLTPFSVYQGLWSVNTRDFERDIIPMCISEGLAIAPWGAMGGGKFQSAAQMAEKKKKNEELRNWGNPDQTESEVKISAALEKVGGEVGASVTAVALAYCLQRTPYVFPIIGGRKIEHLKDNIRALEISLSEEQIKFLESQTELDLGFPLNMIGTHPGRSGDTQSFLVKSYMDVQWVKHAPAIQPRK